MPGRKAAAFEGGFPATEKSMVKRTTRGYVNRALSARDRFDCKVYDCAVGVSLAAQYRSTHLILIMPEIASNQKGTWHGNNFSSGNVCIEHVVNVVEVASV